MVHAPDILLIESAGVGRPELGALLDSKGYRTTLCDPRGALVELERRAFGAVVVRQELPGESGLALVHTAWRAGLLGDAVAVVFGTGTAPLPTWELEQTLARRQQERLRRKLEAMLEPGPARTATEAVEEALPGASVLAFAPFPVELTLYVSPLSPDSRRALRALDGYLRGRPALPFHLELRDVSRDRSGGVEADRIAFTPTLVKHGPGRPFWIIGNLEDTELLDLVFASPGAEPAALPR